MNATGLQMILDEDQRTAVVIQFFDSAEDLRDSEAAFDAMDPLRRRARGRRSDRGEVRLDLKM